MTETTATKAAVYPRVFIQADGEALALYLQRSPNTKPLFLGPANDVDEKQLRLLAVSEENQNGDHTTLVAVRHNNKSVLMYVVGEERRYCGKLNIHWEAFTPISVHTAAGPIITTDESEHIYLAMFAGGGYAFVHDYPASQYISLLGHHAHLPTQLLWNNGERALMTVGDYKTLHALVGSSALENLQVESVIAAVPMDDGYCAIIQHDSADYGIVWVAPHGYQRNNDAMSLQLLEGLTEPPVLKSSGGTAVYILYRPAGSDELRALLFSGFNADGKPDLTEADPRDA